MSRIHASHEPAESGPWRNIYDDHGRHVGYSRDRDRDGRWAAARQVRCLCGWESKWTGQPNIRAHQTRNAACTAMIPALPIETRDGLLFRVADVIRRSGIDDADDLIRQIERAVRP